MVEHALVDDRADIIYQRTEHDWKNSVSNRTVNGTVRFSSSCFVLFHAAFETVTIAKIDHYHKQQCHTDAGDRSKCTSCCCKCGSKLRIAFFLTKLQAVLQHHISTGYRDDGIDDLLNDLRHRCRDHRTVSLEESTQYTGQCKKKDRRCKDTKCIACKLHPHHILGDHTAKQESQNGKNTACHGRKTQGTDQNLVGIFHFSCILPLCYQPGYSKRKAERRNHQDNSINLICGRIITVSVIPQNVSERNTVDHTDCFCDKGGDYKNRPLCQKICFA